MSTVSAGSGTTVSNPTPLRVGMADDSEAEDLDETSICHWLQTPWTLYYFKFSNQSQQVDWKSQMQRVGTVESIEEFWATLQHIRKPSEAKKGSDYIFFREHIFPEWEDEKNRRGGFWEIKLDDMRTLDAVWCEVAMLCIGEQFEGFNDQVCGVYVNVRARGPRTRVWTDNASDEEAQMAIGKRIQSVLFEYCDGLCISIDYILHSNKETLYHLAPFDAPAAAKTEK